VSFCAICTRDIVGEPRHEPLGRDGAVVVICGSCAGDAPLAASAPISHRARKKRGGPARAAQIAYETGRSLAEVSAELGVSRGGASEWYRRLFPHAPLSRGRRGGTNRKPTGAA
jgi:hypothetical protein